MTLIGILLGCFLTLWWMYYESLENTHDAIELLIRSSGNYAEGAVGKTLPHAQNQFSIFRHGVESGEFNWTSFDSNQNDPFLLQFKDDDFGFFM